MKLVKFIEKMNKNFITNKWIYKNYIILIIDKKSIVYRIIVFNDVCKCN